MFADVSFCVAGDSLSVGVTEETDIHSENACVMYRGHRRTTSSDVTSSPSPGSGVRQLLATGRKKTCDSCRESEEVEKRMMRKEGDGSNEGWILLSCVSCFDRFFDTRTHSDRSSCRALSHHPLDPMILSSLEYRYSLSLGSGSASTDESIAGLTSSHLPEGVHVLQSS